MFSPTISGWVGIQWWLMWNIVYGEILCSAIIQFSLVKTFPLYSVGWPSTFSGFRFDTIVSYQLGCQTLDEWSSSQSHCLYSYISVSTPCCSPQCSGGLDSSSDRLHSEYPTLVQQPDHLDSIWRVHHARFWITRSLRPDMSGVSVFTQLMALASSDKRTCICYSRISNFWLICTLFNWIMNWSAGF